MLKEKYSLWSEKALEKVWKEEYYKPHKKNRKNKEKTTEIIKILTKNLKE